MAKILRSNELAEVVTGLLIAPESMNALETPDQYLRFMTAIAQVVADHCGGEVHHATLGLDERSVKTFGDDLEVATVAIAPNHSLPPVRACPWAHFDPQGWESLGANLPEQGDAADFADTAPDEAATAAFRASIHGLLRLAYDNQVAANGGT